MPGLDADAAMRYHKIVCDGPTIDVMIPPGFCKQRVSRCDMRYPAAAKRRASMRRDGPVSLVHHSPQVGMHRCMATHVEEKIAGRKRVVCMMYIR